MRPLSGSQMTCLRYTALGLSQKEIAREMGITPYTVKDYMELARARLGARNTSHAVALAVRSGLLDDLDLTPGVRVVEVV